MFTGDFKGLIIKFVVGAALLSGIVLTPKTSFGALSNIDQQTGSPLATEINPTNDLLRWDDRVKPNRLF